MLILYPLLPHLKMTTKQTAPARKKYCVWADYVCRMYQQVEASSPQEAYDLANESETWEFCDEHDTRDYRLSNEVLDLETYELVPIHDELHCKTCGSEIVETINNSEFREGECGPCEYERYRSQPRLLEAASEALAILGEIMCDLEGDKGEAECVRLLDDAINEAYGNAA